MVRILACVPWVDRNTHNCSNIHPLACLLWVDRISMSIQTYFETCCMDGCMHGWMHALSQVTLQLQDCNYTHNHVMTVTLTMSTCSCLSLHWFLDSPTMCFVSWCSSIEKVQIYTPDGTRTHSLLIRSQTRCHCATGDDNYTREFRISDIETDTECPPWPILHSPMETWTTPHTFTSSVFVNNTE